jgi:hypothetical protein
MVKILIVSLVLLGGVSAQSARNASGGVLKPEQAVFDVRHYDLKLAIDPENKSINGSLTMDAIITAETKLVILDLDSALKVRSVKVGDKVVEFKHADGMIRIPLGKNYAQNQELKVLVEYGGQPRIAPRPPWSGGFTWSKTKSGAHWIAMSRKILAAAWFSQRRFRWRSATITLFEIRSRVGPTWAIAVSKSGIR